MRQTLDTVRLTRQAADFGDGHKFFEEVNVVDAPVTDESPQRPLSLGRTT